MHDLACGLLIAAVAAAVAVVGCGRRLRRAQMGTARRAGECRRALAAL